MSLLNNRALFRSGCYLDGKWVQANSGESIPVDNPATGEIIGNVPNCKKEETNAVIDAMWEAFEPWAELTPLERGFYLTKWYNLIEENKEDLGKILSIEQGKPVAESIGEIALGASYIPWYAEESRRVYGDIIPPPRKNIRPITFYKPVGPVMAVTPWNFPFSMITRKAAPALAAGCPILIKPASATPYSALALAYLAEKAGIPSGVFNVITGSAKEIMNTVAENPKIRKVSFTGSTPVGKTLMAQNAQTVKRLALELGGNAPFIVFDDANLDLAAKLFLSVKFRNAGQACIAANRIFVQEGIFERFLEKIIPLTKNLKVASCFEPQADIGPLINISAVETVESMLEDGLKKGATIHLGGKRHALGKSFFQPTIISGITPEMRLFQEEVFGPVASLTSFTTEEEVIAMANDTPYGLASYVFTQDLGKSWRVPEKLEFGLCGVNEGALALAEAPFGGIKESGMGREGGHEGLTDFMESRYVLVGGI